MDIILTRGPWTPDSAAEILLVVGAALAVHAVVLAAVWILTRRERRILRDAGISLFQ